MPQDGLFQFPGLKRPEELKEWIRRGRPTAAYKGGLLAGFGTRMSEWLWEITLDAHEHIHSDGTEAPPMSLTLSNYAYDGPYIPYFNVTSSTLSRMSSPASPLTL
jgi:hypothetical protein